VGWNSFFGELGFLGIFRKNRNFLVIFFPKKLISAPTERPYNYFRRDSKSEKIADFFRKKLLFGIKNSIILE